MVTCPHCTSDITPAAGRCRECGRPAYPAAGDPDWAAAVAAPVATVAANQLPPHTKPPGVADTPPPADPLPALKPRLVVVRGEQVDVAFPLLPGRNYLGRSGDKPIDIDLTGQEPIERIWTSRQHAVVAFEDGALAVEDLVSLNGTFVNRTRLHPGQPRGLQPGDIVQVGTVQLRVEMW